MSEATIPVQAAAPPRAAVTPADQAKFGVSWSLKLTNEGGYIVALHGAAPDSC